MKTHRFVVLLFCFAFWTTGLPAATKYWDIDGATPGAGGATPAGTWDTGTTANWTTDSTGSSAGTTWTSGDDAVFSAGTDAVGAFTITLDNLASPPVQTAGNLTVEEGDVTIASDPFIYLNIGGGVAGKGIINVAAGASATISAELDAYYGTLGDNNGTLTKTGPGTLTLSAANAHSGTNLVAEGVVIASNPSAFGSLTTTPTIVSNGATVQANIGISETIILNGNGVTNGGAFRDALPANGACSGQIILGSDTRMVHTTSVNFSFGGLYCDGTNNANGYANLTVAGDAGGFHRFNIGGWPAIRLGQGHLIKEGLCQHNFEVPNDIGAIEFNGGRLNWRQSQGGGTGVVYVAASAGTIMATAENINIANNFILAAGANVGISERPQDLGLTFSGVISGPGGLTKLNEGPVIFASANTYQGNTIIEAGTLRLVAGGSISNSPLIELVSLGGTNSIFDVSAVAGGFVLQPGQMLKGNGYVGGDVTADGPIAPGNSIGTLTFSNNLVVSDLLIEVDKSVSPSNDVIAVAGTLTAGSGTVTVNNIGSGLTVGDTFYLFTDGVGNHKAVSGGASLAVVGAGANWNNNLAGDGSISVTSLIPAAPATNLTVSAVGPNTIGIGGNGAANAAYDVYAYTNVATPMSNWWKIGTTNSTAGGVIQFVDPQATNAYRFYRFGQPSP